MTTCYVTDSGNLTAGVVVALLAVLGAGLIIAIKRKALVDLLFTSKKDPIEKLRCFVRKRFINFICHVMAFCK